MTYMRLPDTDDQAALRQTLREFLRRTSDPAPWQRLTQEIGLIALAVPERYDGLGAGVGGIAVAVEELGRVLSPVPYLPTAVVGQLLAEGTPDVADRFLPRLAAGELIGGVAADQIQVTGARTSGIVRHVLHGGQADVFAVPADGELYLVRAGAARVTPRETLDQSRPQADVEFADAPAAKLGVPAERAQELMQVLLAVESVGAAEQLLAMTVAYLKTRVQFGRPIGTFQVLRHRCADLAVAVASARATADAAVRAADQEASELAILAPLAKRHCADVFLHVAAEAIQLHGGIGFTWEHSAHRFFKRAKTTQLLHGTPDDLRRTVASRAGLIG